MVNQSRLAKGDVELSYRVRLSFIIHSSQEGKGEQAEI